MTSKVVDLAELDTRVKTLIESKDLEGIALVDDEIRAYLNLDGDSNAAITDPEQLQRLSEIYTALTNHVGSLRDGLATELRAMKTNQKGIKAYQSSE